MREDSLNNRESIYYIIKTSQMIDPNDDVSITTIRDRFNGFKVKNEKDRDHLIKLGWTCKKKEKSGYFLMNKEIEMRTVYHHLEKLIEDKKVIRTSRGFYSTDYAMEIRHNANEGFKKIISFTNRDLLGVSEITPNFLSYENMKIDPSIYLPVWSKINDSIFTYRMKVHGKKEMAKEESNLWTSTFLNNISLDIEGKGFSFNIKPGKMRTERKTNIMISLMESLTGQNISDVKYGVDALFFENAANIIYHLLSDLIDDNTFNISKNKSEILVKIKFDMIGFYYNFERFKQVKKMYGKQCYLDFPDNQWIKEQLTQEGADAQNKSDELLSLIRAASHRGEDLH